MPNYMKKPCKHCPYRNDVKPFLTPSRGEELAYLATNSFGSFPCHKTTQHHEESDIGEMIVVGSTKECAGFLTLRAQCGKDVPDGFEPSWGIVYTDPHEMSDAYDDTNDE